MNSSTGSLFQVASDVQVEVELYETMTEREKYDNFADLYSIIMATDYLEKAYAGDAITRQEYTKECNKLIAQFKMAEKAALEENTTTEDFMKLWEMNCPRAKSRLLKWGVPQQIKSNEDKNTAVTVAEAVACFITAMDAVRLEERAVDELQPHLKDLMDALTKVPETPNDFEPNFTINKWLKKLNQMRAVDEITETDARQLNHDLSSAYAEFTNYLKRNR